MSKTPGKNTIRRRAGSAAAVTALALAVSALAAPSASAAGTANSLRAREVAYAESHWNWTAWNDRTPVAFGSSQPDFQCAEFVARALAAAGLVPGLGPNDPQDAYYHYTAPNGTTYDLLLISDLPQYHNLYDYLKDSGLGKDVGNRPSLARPGDVVVTYAGPGGAKSHVGLVATAQRGTAEPTVDAHNNARLHYGYHYYAPSHLVRIDPTGLKRSFRQPGRTASRTQPAQTAPAAVGRKEPLGAQS
ncbi:hypothetical protein [Kitasatospora sp. NPDC093102]|uniref:hypothetical protein n=1 Tax=Kitasatospora sp. NPDC093102 TaxID=3155069 RepID=UPI003416829B